MSDLRAVRMLALDFDGCLTSNTVYVAQDGTELVRCSRLDGIGLARLHRLGIPAVVISSERNPVVGVRCEKLPLAEWHSGVEDKLAVLREIADRRGVALADVAYLGNDINDLDCLRAVGHPWIVRDAHDSVRGFGFQHTKKNGGAGAVRELCDLIADAHEAERQAYREAWMRRAVEQERARRAAESAWM